MEMQVRRESDCKKIDFNYLSKYQWKSMPPQPMHSIEYNQQWQSKLFQSIFCVYILISNYQYPTLPLIPSHNLKQPISQYQLIIFFYSEFIILDIYLSLPLYPWPRHQTKIQTWENIINQKNSSKSRNFSLGRTTIISSISSYSLNICSSLRSAVQSCIVGAVPSEPIYSCFDWSQAGGLKNSLKRLIWVSCDLASYRTCCSLTGQQVVCRGVAGAVRWRDSESFLRVEGVREEQVPGFEGRGFLLVNLPFWLFLLIGFSLGSALTSLIQFFIINLSVRGLQSLYRGQTPDQILFHVLFELRNGRKWIENGLVCQENMGMVERREFCEWGFGMVLGRMGKQSELAIRRKESESFKGSMKFCFNLWKINKLRMFTMRVSRNQSLESSKIFSTRKQEDIKKYQLENCFNHSINKSITKTPMISQNLPQTLSIPQPQPQKFPTLSSKSHTNSHPSSLSLPIGPQQHPEQPHILHHLNIPYNLYHRQLRILIVHQIGHRQHRLEHYRQYHQPFGHPQPEQNCQPNHKKEMAVPLDVGVGEFQGSPHNILPELRHEG